MKNFLLGLIATVFISLSANAQTTSTSKRPWYLALLALSVDVQMGHNDYINGHYVECIRDGFCRVRVNRTANWVKTDLSDIKIDVPFIAVDINDGSLYIMAPESFKREEFTQKRILKYKTDIDEASLEILNNQIHKVNPKAVDFKGLIEGMPINPYLENGYYKIKIN